MQAQLRAAAHASNQRAAQAAEAAQSKADGGAAGGSATAKGKAAVVGAVAGGAPSLARVKAGGRKAAAVAAGWVAQVDGAGAVRLCREFHSSTDELHSLREHPFYLPKFQGLVVGRIVADLSKNDRWKTLDEIYKYHILHLISELKSVKQVSRIFNGVHVKELVWVFVKKINQMTIIFANFI